MEISEFIKKSRLNCKMTQSELAELINVKHTTISNYECNVSIPDAKTLIRIAEVLKSDLGELSASRMKLFKTVYAQIASAIRNVNQDNLVFMPISPEWECSLCSKNSYVLVERNVKYPPHNSIVLAKTSKNKVYVYRTRTESNGRITLLPQSTNHALPSLHLPSGDDHLFARIHAILQFPGF